jgi:glycine/D-amino acid oxidase-like deaminating enzyme
LAAFARTELAVLNFPPPAWTLPAVAPDGSQALDVLVAGAGMCGQTAAYALVREGIPNVRVIDREARGDEGPWATYARMLTLRSPKHLIGPDLGVPALTFRAWYEAQHGEPGLGGAAQGGTGGLARLPALGARHGAPAGSTTA